MITRLIIAKSTRTEKKDKTEKLLNRRLKLIDETETFSKRIARTVMRPEILIR
jgi:hypothetical protein